MVAVGCRGREREQVFKVSPHDRELRVENLIILQINAFIQEQHQNTVLCLGGLTGLHFKSDSRENSLNILFLGDFHHI